ncbi:MAG: DUF4476 domain-containing protein [Chitinophagaceae bacterium]
MKKVSLFFAGLLMTLSILAQHGKSAVKITVYGNKNLQISFDEKVYPIFQSIVSGNKTTLDIRDLEIGDHALLVTRSDPNSRRTEKISTLFSLRRRYDLYIKVNTDGSLELLEKKKPGINANRTAMNSADFTNLLNNVKYQRTTIGKRNLIANAFNAPNYYFLSSQVVQLIQQLILETYRLELAKLSYHTITDRNNFSQVYYLLNSQANRDELDDYVNNYYEEDDLPIAMSDASFTTLFENIKQQWPVNTQMNSLVNAFNNTNNYFTTYQASRLIQLVSAESNRLQLAKLSYRSITDKDNFHSIVDLLYSQSGRDELENYVNNYSEDGTNALAMTDANFNSLYQTIEQQWPVSTQMNSLVNAFNNTNNYFTTSQASRLIQLVNAENNRLQLAKLSYRSIVDRVNFSQIYSLLSTQASKNELEAYVRNYGGGGAGYKVAMADADFNALYQNIQQQWPVSTQMSSLTNTFNNTNYYFTTYQASRLIQLVSAENNRLQLAKLSYRSIVDPVNFSQIYSLLSTQASKNELEAYVRNYGGGGAGYKVAMSDAEFNTIYQNTQIQFLPGAKMASITNTFNNTSYYFTVAQAKKLIELVSLESNRLQLAKLSYRMITDRGNFSQLYDLFSTQASKDELAAYVNAYVD